MSSWSYKVKTAVYSGVKDVSSIEARLISEVALKLLIYIIQNWFKTTTKNNLLTFSYNILQLDVFLLSLQSKFNFVLTVRGQIVKLVLEYWSTDQSRVAMDLTPWTSSSKAVLVRITTDSKNFNQLYFQCRKRTTCNVNLVSTCR